MTITHHLLVAVFDKTFMLIFVVTKYEVLCNLYTTVVLFFQMEMEGRNIFPWLIEINVYYSFNLSLSFKLSSLLIVSLCMLVVRVAF